MPMTVVHTESTNEFVEMSLRWMVGTILKALQENDEHITIGVSGGSTPGPIYARLATERSIDWSRILVFLVDERYVPTEHTDSNQRMVWETLLTHEASRARALMPNTALALPDCIESYNEQLRDIRPDIVLLGMGNDGHIASLFPPLPADAFGPDRVIHTTTERFRVPDRISVTLPVLLGASERLMLTTGAEKSALLATMQEAPEDFSRYPAQYLFDERTTWITGP